MEIFIRISLIIHVIAGSLALLSGLGAILLRNKVKLHKPFGKFYFWCMTVIFVTALYLSVFRQNYFLLFIAIFTYYSCLTAFRSLKLKKLHTGQKPMAVDWLIEGLNGAANIGLVVLGIILFTKDEMQWTIITVSFGLLGLRSGFTNIKRLRGKVNMSNYWLLAHIGGMLGSYIGAITAFLVNNNRWIGMPQVMAWLAPTVILVPFIFYEIGRHKKLGKKLAAA
jgi:uncharacterized membrane protein